MFSRKKRDREKGREEKRVGNKVENMLFSWRKIEKTE